MKVKFGVGLRKSLSGAELALRFGQVCSMLCALYLLAVSTYRPAMLHPGPLAALFELSAAALPRWWLLVLALLYRVSGSEVLLSFAILVPALAFGLAAGRLLGEKRTALPARKVYAALLLADLLLRLLPFRFNLAFGIPFAGAGLLLRLGCLALLLLDLRAARKVSPAAAGPAK